MTGVAAPSSGLSGAFGPAMSVRTCVVSLGREGEGERSREERGEGRGERGEGRGARGEGRGARGEGRGRGARGEGRGERGEGRGERERGEGERGEGEGRGETAYPSRAAGIDEDVLLGVRGIACDDSCEGSHSHL